MFNLWDFILKLFGRTPNKKASEKKEEYTQSYENTQKINLTAMFANKLATLTVCESNIDIIGNNKRADGLRDIANRVLLNLKSIVARCLGTGGVLIIPYVANGKIYYDVVSQERLNISKCNGDDITVATVLADKVKLGDKVYHRWTDYEIKDNTLLIKNRATEGVGKSVTLDTVPAWASILPEYGIANVTQMPFAYLKSPVDNRRQSHFYGVPITYGTDEIIKQIEECMAQIADEYASKDVKIFLDERMVSKGEDNKPRKLKKYFFKLQNVQKDNSDLISVFDPAIRDSAYYNRLQNLFELLEKAVGTSRGILTEQTSQNATATEVKRATYDTYSMVEAMRKNIEKAVKDFFNACNVLSNYYNLSPMGDYEPTFSWSYSLIENSIESWQQLQDGYTAGVVEGKELRQFLFPAETLDESETAVEKIKESQPNTFEV